MTDRLTPEREAEIVARAAAATPGPWGLYESGTMIDVAADLEETGCGYRARREIARFEDEPLDNDPTHKEWTAEEDWEQVRIDAEFVAHAREDVPALFAELAAVRAELRVARVRVAELEALTAQATEFRLWEPGYGLYVRRAPGAANFGVLEARRTDKGRRCWTTAGWQYSAVLSHDELFCWPDAQTAVAEARRMMPGAAVREESATAAVYLATPCATCDHTLNWHRNDVGCTAGGCVCGRFAEPTEQAVS